MDYIPFNPGIGSHCVHTDFTYVERSSAGALDLSLDSFGVAVINSIHYLVSKEDHTI